MGTTINELAKICGVSRTTVIRALHGEGRISDETKSLILQKAKELHYQPNLVARSLVSGKSMILGIVVPDLHNQYFPKIVDSVAKTVNTEGYLLNIMVHEDDKENEKRIIRDFIGHNVDGIIINPINKGADFEKMMDNLPVPHVVMSLDDLADGPCVGIDETAAGEAATEYMISKGYRHLLFVAPSLYDRDHQLNIGHHCRLEGFERAAGKAGVEYEILSVQEYAQQAVKRMEKKDHPAFLCSGAMFASEVMAALRDKGYKPVQDYGIMSFDQLDYYKNWSPRLTAVDNHPEQIGEEAGKLLVKLCRSEDTAERVVVPFQIVEGESL